MTDRIKSAVCEKVIFNRTSLSVTLEKQNNKLGVSLLLAKKLFSENHLPEKHFPERSFSRINI